MKHKATDATLVPLLKKHLVGNSAQHVCDVITNAVVQYLVMSLRPIAEVENDGFRNLLSVARPDYCMPCRRTICSKVMQSCE